MPEHLRMTAPLDTLNEVLDKICRVLEFKRVKALPENVYPKKIFGYQLFVGRLEVTGIAKCNYEAKQFAARYMLILLAKKGYPVPPPHGFEDDPNASPDDYIYTELLREFCLKYQLDLCYSLIGDADLYPPPPHYTVSVRVGRAERQVTAPTRKYAQDLASKFMLEYLQATYADFIQEFLSTDEDHSQSKKKCLTQ